MPVSYTGGDWAKNAQENLARRGPKYEYEQEQAAKQEMARRAGLEEREMRVKEYEAESERLKAKAAGGANAKTQAMLAQNEAVKNDPNAPKFETYLPGGWESARRAASLPWGPERDRAMEDVHRAQQLFNNDYEQYVAQNYPLLASEQGISAESKRKNLGEPPVPVQRAQAEQNLNLTTQKARKEASEATKYEAEAAQLNRGDLEPYTVEEVDIAQARATILSTDPDFFRTTAPIWIANDIVSDGNKIRRIMQTGSPEDKAYVAGLITAAGLGEDEVRMMQYWNKADYTDLSWRLKRQQVIAQHQSNTLTQKNKQISELMNKDDLGRGGGTAAGGREEPQTAGQRLDAGLDAIKNWWNSPNPSASAPQNEQRSSRVQRITY